MIDRPRAPLAARFGEAFVRRLDQALGRDDEPITPRLPIPPYVAERRFPEPIALETDVLGTIEHLAQELGRLLERRGEGARGCCRSRCSAPTARCTGSRSAPARHCAMPPASARCSRSGSPCSATPAIRVSASTWCGSAALATERCDPAQTGLAAPDHGAELAHLIDRLGARFGLRRVTRLVPQDAHPERQSRACHRRGRSGAESLDLRRNLSDGRRVEAHQLTTRADCWKHVDEPVGQQDQVHERRRLLEGLEHPVGGFVSELVDALDHEHTRLDSNGVLLAALTTGWSMSLTRTSWAPLGATQVRSG